MYYILNYGLPLVLIVGGVIILIAFIAAKVRKGRTSSAINFNQRDLVTSISTLATSGEGYWAISSEVGDGQHLSVYIHRPSGQTDRYGFREHGFDSLTRQGMNRLFDALVQKLHGHVETSYREAYGSGSDAVSSISSSFTPGGGTGYTANTCGGGGSVRIPTGITMYSPTEWSRRMEQERQKKERESQYRKTF